MLSTHQKQQIIEVIDKYKTIQSANQQLMLEGFINAYCYNGLPIEIFSEHDAKLLDHYFKPAALENKQNIAAMAQFIKETTGQDLDCIKVIQDCISINHNPLPVFQYMEQILPIVINL